MNEITARVQSKEIISKVQRKEFDEKVWENDIDVSSDPCGPLSDLYDSASRCRLKPRQPK